MKRDIEGMAIPGWLLVIPAVTSIVWPFSHGLAVIVAGVIFIWAIFMRLGTDYGYDHDGFHTIAFGGVIFGLAAASAYKHEMFWAIMFLVSVITYGKLLANRLLEKSGNKSVA